MQRSLFSQPLPAWESLTTLSQVTLVLSLLVELRRLLNFLICLGHMKVCKAHYMLSIPGRPIGYRQTPDQSLLINRLGTLENVLAAFGRVRLQLLNIPLW